MRRIVVGVAAGLLLGGSAIASIPPACADTYRTDLKVSHFVRVDPGLSVGLVTVTAGGGKVRHDEHYMAETSIKVVPTSWVGTVPTTLWVDGGVVDHPTEGRLMTVRAAGFAPEAFRPGTQWVVQVRDVDAWMPNHPLPEGVHLSVVTQDCAFPREAVVGRDSASAVHLVRGDADPQTRAADHAAWDGTNPASVGGREPLRGLLGERGGIVIEAGHR